MKYYIVKMYHNHFKCKIPDNLNVNILVNNFIKHSNKGVAKSDRIHLKSVHKITEQQFIDSILFDETYWLI